MCGVIERNINLSMSNTITLGDALSMAPAPYAGKLWLTVADFMALESVGEQKALELLAAEAAAECPRYYVEKCGRNWRVNAAQYFWFYFVGCRTAAKRAAA